MAGKLGIVAGSGGLPRRLIESCRAAGREVFVLALEGEADRTTVERVPHAWCRIGGAAAGPRLVARATGSPSWCSPAACAAPRSPRCGPIGARPSSSPGSAIARSAMTGCLSAVVKELEREGFRVIGADQLLDNAALPEGPLGARAARRDCASADIARGMRIARAIGALDIGQAVVVQQGLVLGVEAIEGTDALLRRCAALRRDGPGGVLVKAEKPGQERRADRPTIGPRTVALAAEAGCAASPSRPARRSCSTATKSSAAPTRRPVRGRRPCRHAA